jgi:hypothetical protein
MKIRFCPKDMANYAILYFYQTYINPNIEHHSGDMYETSYKLLNPTTSAHELVEKKLNLYCFLRFEFEYITWKSTI